MTVKKKVTKKKATTKAVAVKEENLLVEGNLSQSLAALGAIDPSILGNVELDVADDIELFKNDIVIPKIHLIQSMSELRKAKKATEGDFVDSRSEQILLAEDAEEDHLKIIIMKTFKRWQTFELVKDGNDIKKEFVSSEIMTAENAELAYQEVAEGKELTRRQVISCYVLLGSDAQRGIIKPYIVDFAGGSGKGAGRAMVSDIKVLNTDKKDPITGQLIRKGMPSWVAWFKLGQYETSMNDNDFNAKSMQFGGMLPDKMWGFLKDANDEIKALMQNDAVEIDDRDLHESAKAATKPSVEAKVNTSAATDAGI